MRGLHAALPDAGCAAGRVWIAGQLLQTLPGSCPSGRRWLHRLCVQPVPMRCAGVRLLCWLLLRGLLLGHRGLGMALLGTLSSAV